MEVDQAAHPISIRILNIPLVMRYDNDEEKNNCKTSNLFGYPHLFKLPSMINAEDLDMVVKKVIPQTENYTLLLVNAEVCL